MFVERGCSFPIELERVVRNAVTKDAGTKEEDSEEFKYVVEGNVGLQKCRDVVEFGQGFCRQTAGSGSVVEFDSKKRAKLVWCVSRLIV
jgi:hypothetical protein